MKNIDKLKLFPLARVMTLALFSWAALSGLTRGITNNTLSETLIGVSFVFWCVESFLKPIVFAKPTPEFLERKALATIGSPALHRFLSVSAIVCMAGGYIARYLIER